MLVKVAIIYAVISLLYGIYTIAKWNRIDKDMSRYPIGDIGEYVFYPDDFGKIGLLHILLLPSLLVVLPVRLF